MPSASLVTAMKHDECPMHFIESLARVPNPWHDPSCISPQAPVGFPKLANKIWSITVPGGHAIESCLNSSIVVHTRAGFAPLGRRASPLLFFCTSKCLLYKYSSTSRCLMLFSSVLYTNTSAMLTSACFLVALSYPIRILPLAVFTVRRCVSIPSFLPFMCCLTVCVPRYGFARVTVCTTKLEWCNFGTTPIEVCESICVVLRHVPATIGLFPNGDGIRPFPELFNQQLPKT